MLRTFFGEYCYEHLYQFQVNQLNFCSFHVEKCTRGKKIFFSKHDYIVIQNNDRVVVSNDDKLAGFETMIILSVYFFEKYEKWRKITFL